MLKMGFDMSVAPRFKDMLIDAGFVDVVEEKFEVPWGAWPKERRLRAIGFWHVGVWLETKLWFSASTDTSYRTTQARPPGDRYGTAHQIPQLDTHPG
jgi:hypothetical protein